MDLNKSYDYYLEIKLEGAKTDDVDRDKFERTVQEMADHSGLIFYSEINNEGDLLRLMIYTGWKDSCKKIERVLKKVKPEELNDVLKFIKEVRCVDFSKVPVSCAVSLQEMMKVMMVIVFIYVFAGIF